MEVNRIPFIDSQGKLRYTWEQNLDEIILYFTTENLNESIKDINSGKQLHKDAVDVVISYNRLKVQNKIAKVNILDDSLFDTVDISESLWYIGKHEKTNDAREIPKRGNVETF
ncbi:CS domain-containing protein [Cryptosporidium felis]|nr:CS domain-containing protein [Cryptosporidium felis]